MASLLVKRLLSLFLAVVAVFRRMLCFLRRRRRNSGMILPTITPGLDSHNPTLSVPSSVSEPFVMESWDNWGEESNPQHTNPMVGAEGPDPLEPDYFSDMTPQFRKPTRIVVKKKVDENNGGPWTNKLSMKADLTYQDSSGLGTWDDGENAWEGEMDDDLVSEAELVLREKRHQERERRLAEHQRKKLDKDSQRPAGARDQRLGTRLS